MKKLMTVGLALALFAGPAYAKEKVRHYKIVMQDGGESTMPGTKVTVQGAFVLIWLGKVIDTVVTLPKYVTEVPAPDPKPTPEPEPAVNTDTKTLTAAVYRVGVR